MRRTLALFVLAILLPCLIAADSDKPAVDAAAKRLKSRDTSERVEAAEFLGKLKLAEGVAPLMTALEDRDARVRMAAAGALWDSAKVAQPAIPALRKALSDSDAAVVVRAAGALINMDVPAAEIADPLRMVLRVGDSVDRFLAARALIGVDPGEKLAKPLLDFAATHASDADGGKALVKLAKTQERAVIPRLTSALYDTPQIAEGALKALGEFKPRPDRWIEILLGQIKSADPKVRAEAADLLGKQNTAAADVTQWAAPVGRLTSDPDSSVRHRAVWSLEHAEGLAHEGLDGVLRAVANERDKDIRERAAQAVGEIANAAYPISADVKKSMAQRALPVLTAAIANDPEGDVRRAAVRSLDKLQLDHETVLPLLAQAAIKDKDLLVRMAALQAIRNRGKNAAPIAATIAPLLNDPDESIRRDAKAALDMMKSDYSGKQAVVSTPVADSASRERGLTALRESKLEFTEHDFYRALSEQKIEQVTAFLDAGMSPNLRFVNDFGDPVLRVAVERNACGPSMKALVKMLIARGANPKVADDRNNTPLMAAAAKCDAEVIKMLLAAGAEMNKMNITNLTAFEFALFDGNSSAADALVAAGFRLSPAKVKLYLEAYKDEPKKVEIVRKASKK